LWLRSVDPRFLHQRGSLPAATAAKVKPGNDIYQLRAVLRGNSPLVWRRLRVRTAARNVLHVTRLVSPLGQSRAATAFPHSFKKDNASC
jgi:hypothetical protein